MTRTIPNNYIEIAVRYMENEDVALMTRAGHERLNAKDKVRTAFDMYCSKIKELGAKLLGEGVHEGGLEERIPDPKNCPNAFYMTPFEPTYNARYALPTKIIASADTDAETRKKIKKLPFVAGIEDKMLNYPDNHVALYSEEKEKPKVNEDIHRCSWMM